MSTTKSWLDEAIEGRHIKFVPFKEFTGIEFVARGGYGTIKKATWRARKKKVALKSLESLAKCDVDETRVAYKELINELKLLRNFADDDRIIRFYGLTKDPSSLDYVLVMQYANGGTLRNYLAANFAKLTWQDKLRLAIDITSAVDCLHAENIIHRDLHSKNILINNHRAVIADLGLSRIITPSYTPTSRIAGMIPYIDPQRLNNNITSRSKLCDIYSCGVLLWELSSGKVPFANKSHDLGMFLDIFNGMREVPTPDTPVDYYNLYNDCWSFDLSQRPQSTDVILERLEKISMTPTVHDCFGSMVVEKPNEVMDQNSPRSSQMVPTLPDLAIPCNICDSDDQTIDKSNYVETIGISTTQEQHQELSLLPSAPTLNGFTDIEWGPLTYISTQTVKRLDCKFHHHLHDKIFLRRITDLIISGSFSNFIGMPTDPPSNSHQQKILSQFLQICSPKNFLFDRDKMDTTMENSHVDDEYSLDNQFLDDLLSSIHDSFFALFPWARVALWNPKLMKMKSMNVMNEKWKLRRKRLITSPKQQRRTQTINDNDSANAPHDPGGTSTTYCAMQPSTNLSEQIIPHKRTSKLVSDRSPTHRDFEFKGPVCTKNALHSIVNERSRWLFNLPASSGDLDSIPRFFSPIFNRKSITEDYTRHIPYIAAF